MRSIKDNEGTEWVIKGDVGAFRRVRSLTDVDPFDLRNLESSILFSMLDDPIVVCDVLWAFISPQADAKEVTREVFESRMDVDTVGKAREVLLEVLPDFFSDQKQREAVSLLFKMAIASKAKKIEGGLLKLRIQADTLSKLSSNSPELQELTQANSHSGN